MLPGVLHCGGGPGPNQFDMLAAMERWVEDRQPPERILASTVTDGRTQRTRPLCPYPRRAVYRGSGSTDEEASFECR
jgi:feruloyl esterase